MKPQPEAPRLKVVAFTPRPRIEQHPVFKKLETLLRREPAFGPTIECMIDDILSKPGGPLSA